MQKILDKIGISLSVFCMIHCLVIPVLLLVFPIVNTFGFVSSENFHWVLLTLILPIAVLSLGIGCMKHKNYSVLIVALVGIAFLIPGFNHDYEKINTILGGVLVSLSHFWNYQLCHKDCHETL